MPQLSPIVWSTILFLLLVFLSINMNLLPKSKEMSTKKSMVKSMKKNLLW